jgi:phenylacetate-CoA ligase
MIPVTPLEAWISEKIHGAAGLPLTRDDVERYQLERVNETINRVKRQSRFYREHLKHIPDGAIRDLGDIPSLPFTAFGDIARDPVAFSCVPQTQISRVMTVLTSGTTGEQKRIFYTAEDQEATTDFFHHGMACLASPGDRVLILLPGELPGSVGDLLYTALARLGARGHKYGFVDDPRRVMSAVNEFDINVLVGMPIQALSLVRGCETRPVNAIKSVLLTADYVPRAIIRAVEDAWGCMVFNHYGATEMGLGGGVQCGALRGYHMREADMLLEIVDPDTGEPAPDNEYGEVVFTSLTALGTPFVRYRTGDISRFISEPCPCGTALKSLDIVSGRAQDRATLCGGYDVWMRDFDEALFPLDSVLDFEVTLNRENGKTIMAVGVKQALSGADIQAVYGALSGIPSVSAAADAGKLKIDIKSVDGISRRGAKRVIIDNDNKIP